MFGGLEITLKGKQYLFFVNSSQGLIVLFFKRLTPVRMMLNSGNSNGEIICFSVMELHILQA